MKKSILLIAAIGTILLSAAVIAEAETDRDLYKQGESYLQKGSYDNAIKEYQKLIDKYPFGKLLPYALYSQGWCYLEKKDFSKATDDFGKVVKNFPNASLAADAQLAIGECHLRAVQYDKAISAYSDVIKNYPKSDVVDKAYLGRGLCYFKQGKYKEASKALSETVKKFPSSPQLPEARYLLISAYQHLGAYQEAIAQLKDVPAGEIMSNEVFFNIGDSFFKLKDYSQAIEFYRQVRPKDRLLAQIQQKIDYWQEQKKDFYMTGVDPDEILRNISKLKADHKKIEGKEDISAIAWYQVGLCYYNLDKFYEARIAYEYLAQKFPQHSLAKDARYSILLTYQKQSKITELLREYNGFFQAYPKDELISKMGFIVGEALYKQGKYKEAIDEYNKEIERAPKGEFAENSLYRIGDCYISLNNFSEAIKSYEQFLKKYPKSQSAALANFESAYAYTALNQYEQALKLYQSIQQKYPQAEFMDQVIHNIGLCNYRSGNFNEAIKSYKMVLEKFPKSDLLPLVLYDTGNAYLSINMFDEALKTYERLIGKYPGSEAATLASYQVAVTHYYRGEFDKTIQYCQKFITQYPDSPLTEKTSFLVSEAYLKKRDYPKAIEQLRGLIGQSATKTDIAAKAQFKIGEILYSAGKYDEALSEFKMLLEKYPGSQSVNEAVSRISRIYRQQKRYEEAIKTLQEIIVKFSNDKKLSAELYCALGDLYVQQQDYGQAFKTIGPVLSSYPDIPLSPESSYLVGKILLKAEKEKEAVEFYKKVLLRSSDPEQTEKALFGLGQAHIKLKMWTDAAGDFESLLSRYLFSAFASQAKLGLAMCLYEQGKYDKAIEIYKELLTKYKDETMAEAMYQLGNCYFSLKDYEEASRHYLRVSILYSYEPLWAAKSQLAAGRSQENLKKFAEAKSSYKKVIEKYPQTKEAKEAGERLKLIR